MAKGKYQKLYEARMKRLGKTSSTEDDLQRQIANYKARLEAGGVENPEADDRNALEKFLNLEQDQGLIGDVFEILGRPQQAIFTGIKNSQEGGSFLEGMKEGITGNEETEFKDILMNTGAFEDEKGKLNAVDVLGFAGDVFLDPMNIPVAGFGKVGKALDAGDNVFKAMRNADTIDDLLFKAAGKGLKSGAKLADTGIEKGLKYLDETKGVYDKAGDIVKLKYANASAKRGSDLIALDAATGKALDGATGLLQKYKTAKNQVTDAFKLPKGALDAILRRRSADASAYTAKAQSAAKVKEIQEKAEAFAKATNGKYGDATEFINNAYALLNSTTNRTYNVDELLELAKKGELPGYEEVIEPFKKVLDRDVPDKVRKEIEEKLGKDAFEITIDKHNNIKLGKGWYEVELDKSTSSIADEINSLQSQYDELDVPLKDLIEKGIHPLDAEMEMDNISAKIQELRSKELDSKVTLKRRYTPEQEQLLSNLAQAYGHNVDGYRDAVDSIFGTAWKKQDSGIMSNPRGIISDGTFDENGDEIYRQLDPINLSKNQALVMDPDELYTGRGSNRDIIKPTTQDGKLGTVANTKFYTDSPNMAIGYGGETPATPYNLGAEGVYHRGMLPKTNEENILSIGPNGAYNDGEFGYLYQPDTTYDWTNIPYRNKDTYETFNKLSDKEIRQLISINGNSENSAEFLQNLKKPENKKLLNNLKSYGIDLDAIDRPSGTTHYSTFKIKDGKNVYSKNYSKNIDADTLYSLLNEGVVESADDFKSNLDLKLLPSDTGGGYSTDEVVEQIYKNQATGRANKSYNTVELSGIKDSIEGGEGGSDIITFNPGDGSLPRNFKSIYNKTPMLETESIYDIAENSKDAVKGGVDIFNDVIDDALGTKMGTKYHYLTNSDYVASNILTDDGAKIIDEFNEFRGINKSVGNTKLLSSRKYLTTPEETNNFIREYLNKVPDKELKNYPELLKFKHNKDAKFMETDYIKSLTNRYVDDKGYADLASQSKVVSQTLLDSSFKDFDKTLSVQKKMEVEYKTKGTISEKLINEYNKHMENSVIKPLTSFDNKVPNGYVRVTSSDLEDFIRKHSTISGQLGKEDNSKQLRKLLQKVIGSGNDVAINEDVWRTIGAAFERKNVNALSQIYNSYLNTFKMWKTASPTNTLNALIGNTSNLMLGGVSMADQAKFGPKVLDIMQNGEKYYLQRLSGTKLDEASQEIADLWFEFKKLGFGDASLDLSGLPDDIKDLVNKKKSLKGTKDYITKGLPTLFGSINQKMDTVSRLTIMLKAKSDPGFLKHLGVDDVYGAISKIMFDPTVLTSTEKKIKQVLPFYTYAKNNLVYQVTNLPRNANKYSRLMRGMNSLQKSATGNNEENMADYLKDSLYIPIPVLGKDGSYKVIRANLPFGQLIENVEDPIQSGVNMLSPAIKAPIEYATGIDSFTGREIEKFPGERSTQIPFLTKKQQKFISDFSGLDVPLKNAVRIGEGAMEGNIGKGLLNTVTMTNNIDTDKLSKQYDELEELQNMMKQYKQEGYEFSTMTELRKANKNNTIAGLDALFAKYGIDQKTYAERLYDK